MSTWNSIDSDVLEGVALRDNYTGEEVHRGEHDVAPFVDVATATWFHDKIRLIVTPEPLLITAAEARELIRCLEDAVSLVEGARE